MALYKWSTLLAGIWAPEIPDWIVYLTQAEYDELSEEEKMNGTNYEIYEQWDSGNILTSVIRNCVGYKYPKVNLYGYIDLLVVGWWGWWEESDSRLAAWWWGWAWWFIECNRLPIKFSTDSYCVVIWNWWWRAAKWWNTCFWSIVALWWWNWWWDYACAWSGWSWWWGWWRYSQNWISWWSWTQWQWYAWWNWRWAGSNYCAQYWWGWGWAWWAGCNWCNWSWWYGWHWWVGKCSSISWELQWYSWGWGWWVNVSWHCWWCGWCWGWGNMWQNATYYWWWGWGWNVGCWCSWCQWIVILRYHTDWSDWITNESSWGCKYTCWEYTIHCFTTNDAFIPVIK